MMLRLRVKSGLPQVSKHLSLRPELFQPGSGYGNPDARAQDEHRLQTAKHNAERLFQEYHDLDKRDMGH